MLDQLKAIIGVFIHPKSTFQNLPSNKIYVLAFLTPLYFGYARGMRTGSFIKLTEFTGNNLLTYAIVFLIALVAIPGGAFIAKLVVRLFGKKLTLMKLMNLYGYAFVPRLVLAVPASISFAMVPQETKTLMLMGDVPAWFVVLTVVGGIAFLYSIFLYIYGIVVCPSHTVAVSKEG